MDITPDRIPQAHLVAGLAGSVVSLKFIKAETWMERVTHVFAGIAAAFYLTHPAAEWLVVKGPKLESALAFAIGVFGMAIANAVAGFFKGVTKDDIIGLIPWKKKD